MKKSIFLAILIFPFICKAQEFSLEYGKVRLNELTMKEFANDKNADALMIYDIGDSRFIESATGGLEIYFERKFKIKILKKSGFKWSEIEIPYYFEGEIFEQVTDVEAISYNIEGGIIKQDKLNPKAIYDEKKNQYWRNKKFAMPNIKEGTVIEVRYKIISPYVFNLRDWEFQHSIPTVYSQYTTRMTPFYEYIYLMQGSSKFDVYETNEDGGIESRFAGVPYHDLIYKFGMKDIPAFNDETFITSPNDYITKIDFQLAKIHRPNGTNEDIISTWPKLNKDLLAETQFGKYCKSAEKESSKLLDTTGFAKKPSTEKLEYITKLVKNNFNWNGMYLMYTQKTMKEFLKDKTGNCANINLFLVGMLRSAGLEAYPVISSTRDNGKIKSDYPFLHFFNYVLVLVNIDGKFTLVDATEPMLPYNRIPARAINETGLIVKKDSEDWVKLTHSSISAVDRNILINFNPGMDTLNCNINTSYSLYEAYDFKRDYKNKIEDITTALTSKGYSAIDTLTTENYDETEKLYKIKYKAITLCETINQKIFVSPFLYETPTVNPFKQTTRTYPIDFTYPSSKKYRSIIKIPKGYKIEFVPTDLTINNAQVSIEYKTTVMQDSSLVINGIFTLKNAVYPATEYDKIKYYHNEIVKKFNEKVVLVKEI